MENTNVETKVEEKKKEFDIIDMIDPIEKVLGSQHGRVVKDFNTNCEKSMRVVPIVTALINIENYKLLKEIRNLLMDIKNQNMVYAETEEVEKKSGKKKIDLK